MQSRESSSPEQAMPSAALAPAAAGLGSKRVMVEPHDAVAAIALDSFASPPRHGGGLPEPALEGEKEQEKAAAAEASAAEAAEAEAAASKAAEASEAAAASEAAEASKVAAVAEAEAAVPEGAAAKAAEAIAAPSPKQAASSSIAAAPSPEQAAPSLAAAAPSPAGGFEIQDDEVQVIEAYACGQCGAKFSTSNDWMMHVATHGLNDEEESDADDAALDVPVAKGKSKNGDEEEESDNDEGEEEDDQPPDDAMFIQEKSSPFTTIKLGPPMQSGGHWMHYDDCRAYIQAQGVNNHASWTTFKSSGKRPSNVPSRPELTCEYE